MRRRGAPAQTGLVTGEQAVEVIGRVFAPGLEQNTGKYRHSLSLDSKRFDSKLGRFLARTPPFLLSFCANSRFGGSSEK